MDFYSGNRRIVGVDLGILKKGTCQCKSFGWALSRFGLKYRCARACVCVGGGGGVEVHLGWY